MVTSLQVVNTARSFVGIRFKHQGRDVPPHPHPGLDCVGVVAKTAHLLGLSDFDWTNYQRMATWSNQFEACFADNMKREDIRAIRPGMTVIFRQEQFPCHCGIVGFRPGRGLSLIHAYLPSRKVVEEDFAGEWAKPPALMGAFSYHGVEESVWRG